MSDRPPKYTNISRVDVGYHSKRTDARDRSSEDPSRHTLPRANLSPKRRPQPPPPPPSSTRSSSESEAGSDQTIKEKVYKLYKFY